MGGGAPPPFPGPYGTGHQGPYSSAPPMTAQQAKAHAKGAKAQAKAMRPWFKKKRSWLGIIVAFIVLISVLSQCGGSDTATGPVAAAPSTTPPASTDTTTEAPSVDPTTVDPTSAAPTVAEVYSLERSCADIFPHTTTGAKALTKLGDHPDGKGMTAETFSKPRDLLKADMAHAPAELKPLLAAQIKVLQSVVTIFETGNNTTLEFDTYKSSGLKIIATCVGEEPTEEPEPTKKAFSVEQENAIGKAESYLENQAFSRTGLIDQLVYEGFSKKVATFGVDHVDVNWKEQAALKAQSYLDNQSFSRKGLIEQLRYEGFTRSQAEYGVKKVGL